jgi:hypothetical protein
MLGAPGKPGALIDGIAITPMRLIIQEDVASKPRARIISKGFIAFGRVADSVSGAIKCQTGLAKVATILNRFVDPDWVTFKAPYVSSFHGLIEFVEGCYVVHSAGKNGIWMWQPETQDMYGNWVKLSNGVFYPKTMGTKFALGSRSQGPWIDVQADGEFVDWGEKDTPWK